MRDTLIVITFLGAVAAGFYYFTDGRITPDIGAPTASTSQGESFVWKNHGGRNDRNSQKSFGKEDEAGLESSEIDSGDNEEIQRLTSIYPVKKRARSQLKKKKLGSKGRKVVHGVPLQAFADSQKNRIDIRKVPGSVKEGLRVYLQCMELKNQGTDPLNERECDKLLVGNLEQKKGVARHLTR